MRTEFMRFRRFRFYSVLFAVLALTSQAFAFVSLPCSDMTNPGESSGSAMVHAAMDMSSSMGMDHSAHSQHDQANGNGNDNANNDCCGETDCTQSDCLSATIAMVSPHSFVVGDGFQNLDAEYSPSWFIAEPTSLFRPPISR